MEETFKTRIPCKDCKEREKDIILIGKEEYVSCEPTAENPDICLLVTRKKTKPPAGGA